MPGGAFRTNAFVLSLGMLVHQTGHHF